MNQMAKMFMVIAPALIFERLVASSTTRPASHAASAPATSMSKPESMESGTNALLKVLGISDRKSPQAAPTLALWRTPLGRSAKSCEICEERRIRCGRTNTPAVPFRIR